MAMAVACNAGLRAATHHRVVSRRGPAPVQASFRQDATRFAKAAGDRTRGLPALHAHVGVHISQLIFQRCVISNYKEVQFEVPAWQWMPSLIAGPAMRSGLVSTHVVLSRSQPFFYAAAPYLFL